MYASYLIRGRLKRDTKLYPAFIRDIISFPTFRSRLTREARTTAGNYNINTQGLKSLKLINPPRDKQLEALRRITENFDEKNARKSLLVMATGTGKTRTAIALVDNKIHLLKGDWFDNSAW